jgi:hypothetical protein
MTGPRIVCGPLPHVRGHREKQGPIRTQQLKPLPQAGPIVLIVLQNLKCHNQVELLLQGKEIVSLEPDALPGWGLAGLVFFNQSRIEIKTEAIEAEGLQDFIEPSAADSDFQEATNRYVLDELSGQMLPK